MLNGDPRTPAATGGDAALDTALACLERGDWDAAFDAFAALADARDPQAARTALLLAHCGGRLFGGSRRVEAARRERWRAAAGMLPGPPGGC